MNIKIVSFLIFISLNLHSQNLCEKKYTKIIKENTNTYTLESNLKPIKIEWIINDSVHSIQEVNNFYPYDSIQQLAIYPNRIISEIFIYNLNYKTKKASELFPDSLIPVIVDMKNEQHFPKMLHASRRRFQVMNNRVFLNLGLLFEYKNGLYHYLNTDSFYNRFIYRQKYNYVPPYNKILYYHIFNEDIIGDYLLDSSMTYMYYSSKKFNHFYSVNLKTQEVDSISYLYNSQLKALRTDVNDIPLNKKCAITKMQFLNKDSILFSDSCFLGMIDLKNKTSKTLYQFSNEIIHFNIYKNNVYFLNNFSFYYQAQDSFTKFFYYKYDINKQKLDSTEIVLQGKIDSSSFIIDAYNNITCIRYKNTANPDSSYNTTIMPQKRWANLVQFNLANIKNEIEYPKIENNLKYHITSWDAESNLQMDCNGDILFQGTKENDTLIMLVHNYNYNWNDSFTFKNESLYKIVRKINKSFKFDSCEQIKAVVYFADGDTLHTYHSEYCGFFYKNVSLDVCDSIKINAKNYYKTGFFVDTIFTNSIKDTILLINLKVNNTKRDTIKVQTCKTYKFGDSTYTKSGTYTHKFRSASGCDSFSTLVLDSKGVHAQVKVDGNSFVALYPNGTYQWYICNPSWRIVTGANQQIFSTSTQLKYAVIVSDKGCVDTSACIDKNYSGISLSDSKEIQIYPNPFTDFISIKFENTIKENQIEVYNSIGQKIKSMTTKSNEIQVDLKNEAKGVYLIKVNETQLFKMLKL